jgi:hypothetical protein
MGLAARHDLVDQHFAGSGAPEADRRLFGHLRGCEPCRARYRAHALLESLDPDAEARARARLGRGIFAAASPAPRRRWLLGGLGAALAGAAAMLVLGLPGGGMRPRGALPEPGGPSLTLYRISDGHQAERAGAVVKAGESLAFAYTNPPGPQARPYLMVFAFDPQGRVFWFWPAWQAAAANPGALPIAASERPVELGEAVRHPFSPGPLTVVGLFGDRPLTVREVEAALARGEAGLGALGAELWIERVEVLP